MPRPEPPVLPHWTPGTVAILSTGSGAPHAIPVSTGVRVDDRTILIALARRRESLFRLREDARCALTILAEGDIAVTAHCMGVVVQEPMTISDRVAAVRLDVQWMQDHGQPRFEIQAGVKWRWTEEAAERRDAEIRAALTELASQL
jgi:flavin reductase (DIM6/NTAB) family NADH-FMN oxidoreductase RutF